MDPAKEIAALKAAEAQIAQAETRRVIALVAAGWLLFCIVASCCLWGTYLYYRQLETLTP